MLLIAVATGFLALLYDLAFLDQYLTAHPKAGRAANIIFSALSPMRSYRSARLHPWLFSSKLAAGPDLQPRATAAPKSPQQLCLRRMFKRRRLRLRTRPTSPNRRTHGSAFDEDLRHPREKECRPPRHSVMVPSYPQRQASTIHCRLIRVHAECLGGARRSRLNALGKRPPGPPVSSRTRVE